VSGGERQGLEAVQCRLYERRPVLMRQGAADLAAQAAVDQVESGDLCVQATHGASQSSSWAGKSP
jgi:hypothetical protein